MDTYWYISDDKLAFSSEDAARLRDRFEGKVQLGFAPAGVGAEVRPGRGPIQLSLNVFIVSSGWSVGNTSPPSSRRRLCATLHLRCFGFKGLAPAC